MVVVIVMWLVVGKVQMGGCDWLLVDSGVRSLVVVLLGLGLVLFSGLIEHEEDRFLLVMNHPPLLRLLCRLGSASTSRWVSGLTGSKTNKRASIMDEAAESFPYSVLLWLHGLRGVHVLLAVLVLFVLPTLCHLLLPPSETAFEPFLVLFEESKAIVNIGGLD